MYRRPKTAPRGAPIIGTILTSRPLRGMRHFASVFLLCILVSASSGASAQYQWTAFSDARGTRIEYPADVFSVRERAEIGQAFTTSDGRARIHMYSMPNPKALAPGEYMQANFPARRSVLTYDHVARNFFAISTRQGGIIVYVRCNFSPVRGGALHCVDMRYPENEKRAWDAVVTRISRSVRPLPRS